jgi:uncharacterized membrane protein YkoI
MRNRLKFLVAGAAALALAAGGTGLALATGGDAGGDATANNATENDAAEQVSGTGADQARAAGLRITGGGKANSVERDSENGATWEVEITKPNGQTVDVRLDERYQLVVVEADGETGDSSK